MICQLIKLKFLVLTAISQLQEQTRVYTVSYSIVSCYIKWVFNFSRKISNGKVSGPYSQLQLSIMLDLDDTYQQHIIMGRNFILFQFVRLVRGLFQFNDPRILYTSNNQENFRLK